MEIVEQQLSLTDLREALRSVLGFVPSENSIHRWRKLKGLPHHLSPRGRNYYLLSEVVEWLNAPARSSNPSAAGAAKARRKAS